MSTEREILPIASARDTARLLIRGFGKYRGRLIASLIAFAVVGAAGIVAPRMLGKIVDLVSEPETTSGDVLVEPILAIVVATVIGAIASSLAITQLAAATIPVLAKLREDVLDRSLNLDSPRLERAGTGDVMARVGDDVRTVTDALDEAIPMVLTALVAICFTVGGLFALDWRLGLAGLLAVPGYVAASRWYLPRSGPVYRDERIAQGERAEALMETLEQAPTTRAFGREEQAVAHVEATSASAREVSVRAVSLALRYGARMNRAEMFGVIIILTAGFLLVRADIVTVGAATAAALYYHRLFNPIGAVLMLFDRVQAAGASLTRLAGVSLMPERPAGMQPGAESDPGQVALHRVSHAWDGERAVLFELDLLMSPGERIAVVGASGAGKSTLASIVAGLVEPTSGTVRRPHRDDIAVVSQEVHIFSGSLRENLTLAAPHAPDDELLEALSRVGAAAWVSALSEGLQTRLGTFGHPLTSAQAQQVALARIWLRDPGLVVLDEATAEAGSAGARDLETAATEVLHGRTSLVVAHRLTQAQEADRILVMDGGRIVAEGTHAELIAIDGLYAELWRAWSAS